MAPLKSIAHRLTLRKFGQNALAQPEASSIFKQKPTFRVYAGLTMVGFTTLFGLPTLALLGYLSAKLSKPMIIAVGGPVVIALVHILFGVGIYLVGRNYAKEILLRLTKRFLEKYG